MSNTSMQLTGTIPDPVAPHLAGVTLSLNPIFTYQVQRMWKTGLYGFVQQYKDKVDALFYVDWCLVVSPHGARISVTLRVTYKGDTGRQLFASKAGHESFPFTSAVIFIAKKLHDIELEWANQ